MRTLLTTVHPVAQSLQGGAEKVIDIQPLSPLNTAKLLCKLSPRPLLLTEIQGAGSAADFVQRLSLHPIMAGFRGNPGLVKAAAPRLSHVRLHEIHDPPPQGGTWTWTPSTSRDASAQPSPLVSPRASPMPN